jgi:hypothetical protein
VLDIDAATDFLGFVDARHRVWQARQQGLPQPWTTDPIVASRKFTNVFRVLDHGSQYVLTDLVDPELSPRDQLARLFLYRHTGRVEVWEAMDLVSGLPTLDNLDDCLEAIKAYRGKTKVHLKSKRVTPGRGNGHQKTIGERPVFTAAYLVFPQSAERGTDKLDSIFDLTRRLFTPGSPDDLVPDFLAATRQADRFEALRRNKGVADFMSMQVLTDWGYTPHCGQDLENDFVVPGPGARKGAAELGLKPEAALDWALSAVHALPEPPLLGDRLPSRMDIQNCLCEFSKYARFARSASTQKTYSPAHPGVQLPPVLPQHWL